MKYENVPGYIDIREELMDARLEHMSAPTIEKRREAATKVRELRKEMAKLIYEYKQNGGKVR